MWRTRSCSCLIGGIEAGKPGLIDEEMVAAAKLEAAEAALSSPRHGTLHRSGALPLGKSVTAWKEHR